MRIVERFAPIGDDSLEYSFTIDDPASFTRPFTVRLVMVRGGPMYEYACHEGNRALRHMLEAARSTDSGRPAASQDVTRDARGDVQRFKHEADAPDALNGEALR